MINELVNKFNKAFQIKPHLSSAVGIDIGSHSLKVVGIRLSAQPAMIFSSITPITGLTGKDISAAIRTILDNNGWYVKSAVLTFSDESVVIKRVELPNMGPAELPDAVKWQMKDSLRYNIEEALIDFESLGTIDKEDGSKVLSLLVASARRENVESKIAILKDAGLEVVSVSFAPFGFENIVKSLPPEDSSECTLIADIGHSGTEISIFENGRLEFVREAPVSSLEISEALTVTLAGEKGTISLDKDDAEKIKTEIGISYDADEPGAKVSPMQIMALIRPILETLAREIKRSAGYYSQQYGGGKVSRIYLAGGGGNLKNLDRFLQEGLGLLTQTIGMPPSITLLEKDAKKTCASALASVTGAVLGYSGRPNLLPYEYKLEKLEFIGTLSLRIAAFVFAAVLLTSFLFTKTQLSGYRQRLANIEFQRDFLRQVRELKERVDEREALLKRLQSTEIKGYIMMRELSRMMPPNMVLDWIKANIADRTVDIGGIIFGRPGVIEEVITKFMGEMERSKYFSEVQLTSVQHVDGQSEERSKFEINCIIE